MVLFLLKYIPILFVGGFLTSMAEKKFSYNLYDTIIGLFKKKSASTNTVQK